MANGAFFATVGTPYIYYIMCKWGLGVFFPLRKKGNAVHRSGVCIAFMIVVL